MNDDREQRVDATIAGYLQAVDGGQAPDRDALLASHPDLADDLQAFFADHDRTARLAEPIREIVATPDPQATVGPAAGPSPAAELFTIAPGERMPSPGSCVGYFGDYELLSEIARGGMGVVFRARQVSLNRVVALKMILAGQLASAQDVQRFQAEARTAANLQHANIVAIHEVGEHEGQHYFSMDYVEGRNLTDMVRESPLPPQQAARYVKLCAEAIHYAHQQGTLHRDLKPSNVLVDRFDQPRVTDFGLAKQLTSEPTGVHTQTGSVVGTPSYMPPEQASADRGKLGPASDVYSLGAVLYELVTGRPPFRAATPMDTLLQVLSSEPAAPRLVNPSLSRDLETIILKCLAKEPDKRYASALALAEDLQAYMENRPISARRPGYVERAGRWVRQHRRSVALAAITAGVAAALLIGGSALLDWYRESQLGRVVLTTDGPNLVAEVFDERDKLVVPAFTVPTSKPVALPAGAYQLRLSASGLLSETWPLDVVNGDQRSYPVRLSHDWLWSPLERKQEETHLPLNVGGRTDLMVSTYNSLRRVHGASGQQAWSSYFALDEKNPFPGMDPRELRWLQLSGGVRYQFGRLLQPAPDLDGDGVGDLILPVESSNLQRVPALLAVSGQAGRPLWWFSSSYAERPKDRVLEQAETIDRPAVADVDGDGTPDIITLFVDWQKRTWVEAISGRTGKSLWHRQLGVDWLVHDGSSDNRYQNCQPEVMRLKGQAVVMFAAGKKLVGLDLKTGKDAWPALDLGFTPMHPPRFVDVDGDGRLVAFLQRRKEHTEEVELKALSLTTRKILWQIDYHQEHEYNRAHRDLLLLADLNNDGKPEVILPLRVSRPPTGRVSSPLSGGVQVLDGATGQVRWQRLWRSAEVHTGLEFRIITGPDLDGDGWKDVFVAWSASVGHGFNANVAALSGHEGKVLWHWSQPVSRQEAPAPLRWWHPGPDGWPQLITSIYQGGQPVTCVFSGGTGRLLHTLPDVSDPIVADFNGDGILDLAYTVSPQGAPRFLVIRGKSPESFRALGQWQAMQDFDGDGVADFLSLQMPPPSLVARSGRGDRNLWRSSSCVMSHDIKLSPPLPHGDLDGDGIPDVVRVEESHGNPDTQPGTGFYLVAYSGKDGKRLWQSKPFATYLLGTTFHQGGRGADFYRYPCLEWCDDLNGDGVAEVLLTIWENNYHYLGAFSGRDGELLWKIPFKEGSFIPRRFTGQSVLHDLNGDGVPDVVLWVPTKIDRDNPWTVPVELRAYDGRDGKPLWTKGLSHDSSRPVIPPVVGDLDGDGFPEVVILLEKREQRNGTHVVVNEIVALDGRDGKPRWTWAGASGDVQVLFPLVADLDGKGRKSVCFALQEPVKEGFFVGEREPRIVILDAKGKVRSKFPVKDLALHRSWAAFDLDGDGKEELLFFTHEQLCALRGDGSSLWKWSLPRSHVGVIVDLLPVKGKAPATLAVHSDREVYGLVAATGKPRWRGEVSGNPNIVHVLPTSDAQGLPRIVGEWLNPGQWNTVSRQTWPTTPTGEYLPPTPEPLAYAEHAEMGWPRPLPWVPVWGAFSLLHPRWLIPLAAVAFFSGWLGWLALTGRWRRLAILFSLSVVIALILALMSFRFDREPMEAEDYYSWSGWHLIWFWAVCAIVAGLVLWTLLKGSWLCLRFAFDRIFRKGGLERDT